MRLLTIRAARAYATALLTRYHLPTAPLHIEEANGCYGILIGRCRATALCLHAAEAV